MLLPGLVHTFPPDNTVRRENGDLCGRAQELTVEDHEEPSSLTGFKTGGIAECGRKWESDYFISYLFFGLVVK